MPNILAIIPARGGSKGIPGKNLVNLGGKPLIWYTIQTALKSKYINKVVVSTEDAKIASYCNSIPIKVVDRPPELATDESIVVDAVIYTIDYLEQNQGFITDIVVNLNPTSPLRSLKSLDKVLDKICTTDYDSVFGAFPSIYFQRVNYGVWKLNDTGEITGYYDHLSPKRRQDLDRVISVSENGSIYAIRKESLYKHKSLIGIKPSYVFMTYEESVDIDNMIQLQLAEIYLENFFKDNFND